MCNKCVLRVDTHCKWVGDCCIGLLNHKFFILYLWYIVYFCVQIMGPFIKLLFIGSEHLEEDPAAGNLIEYLVEHPNELIVFLLCGLLILVVGLMFMYQIFLLLMNKTTLEVSMDP